MSVAAEKRAEKAYGERRNVWHKEMHRQGFVVVSNADYNTLQDVVSNIALALRRFPTPFDHKGLQVSIRAVYDEAKAILDKTLPHSAFDQHDKEGWTAAEDGKLIYLSGVKP